MDKLVQALRSEGFEASATEHGVCCLIPDGKEASESARLRRTLAEYTGRLVTPTVGRDPSYGPVTLVTGVSDEDLTLCPLCDAPMYFGQVASDYGDHICKKHGRSKMDD